MTDPLSRHWYQPSHESMAFDDTHVLMTPLAFDFLHNYSSTIPTGVYHGKMWKALPEGGEWELRWYGISKDPDKCTCRALKILVANVIPNSMMEGTLFEFWCLQRLRGQAVKV